MAKCKFGKVKFGDRKGKCRTRKVSGAAAKHRKARKLTGAAKYARACQGNTGSAFKACMKHALNGLRRR